MSFGSGMHFEVNMVFVGKKIALECLPYWKLLKKITGGGFHTLIAQILSRRTARVWKTCVRAEKKALYSFT